MANKADQELEKKVNRLNEEISLRDKQIEALKESINNEKSKRSAEIEELKRVSSQKDEEINRSNAKLKDLKEEINALQIKLSNKNPADEEKKALQEEVEKKSTKIDDLNLQISILSQKYEQEYNLKDEKLAQLEHSNSELMKQIEHLMADNSNEITELNKFESAKLEFEAKLKESNDEVSKHQILISQSENKISELSKANAKLTQDNSVQFNKIEKLVSDNHIQSKEIDKLNGNCQMLEKEKNDLEMKITKMKEVIQEIKSKFEQEINQKVEMRNKIIQEMKKEFSTKEDSLIAKLDRSNKERLEYEELIIKQDFKMNELAGKISQIEIVVKNKNAEIKNNEIQAQALIKIIEDQKRQIIQYKEEKKILLNIENELIYLRNFNESLKDDAVAKDEIIRGLKHKLTQKNKIPIDEKKISSIIQQAGNNLLNISGLGMQSQLMAQNTKESVALPNIHKNHLTNVQVHLTSRSIEEIKEIEANNNAKHSPTHPKETNIKIPQSDLNNIYEDYIKLENEEKARNEENFQRINEMMKKVLDE